MNYPSVTQVISPWLDFSKVPANVLELAQIRGTRVHRACAAYAQDVWTPTPPPECAGYVQSFREWFDAAVVEVALAEGELVDPVFGFLGHPDLICRIKGDRYFCVMDNKTPRVLSKAWRVQLAAYLHLAKKNGLYVKRAFSLRLHPQGKAPIINEYTGTVKADLAIFLAALTAWKYFRS